MRVATFFEKFELFAQAPNAVTKMRDLVLQLAMRGKLVEQDLSEGGADSLLKAIESARKKSNRAKTSEVANADESEEVDGWHEVPPTWKWVRLRKLGEIVGGGTPRSDNSNYFANEGIPWLTPADLNGFKAKTIFRGRRCITEAGLRDSSARMLPVGSVIFSSRAPIGYVAIAGVELATNQGFKSCVPFVRETSEFLYYFLKGAAARIDREAPGTTFREVSGKIVGQIPVPLPPLAEQKRIVAKVDELMALCDRLEAQHLKREMGSSALARASLSRFTEAPTPANLEFLFHPSYAITPADLRKSILALAVSGKLVPQRVDEGTGDEVLQALAKGSIEKNRFAERQSLPFEIPESWASARLGDIYENSFYGPRFGKEQYVKEGGVPTIRTTDMTPKGQIVLRDPPHVRIEDKKKLDLYAVRPNDLLLTRSGTIGMMAVFKGDYVAIPSAYLIRFRFSAHVTAEFYYLYLSSLYGQELLGLSLRSIGVPNVNATSISKFPAPVPPLAEQCRIVTRADQLMALVDQLEEQLKESRTAAEKLMEALVARFTNVAETNVYET